MTPEVSIVIVCMNRPDNLRPCLESIRAHTEISYEVFVVAYLFSPDNLDAVRSEFPWVRFIESGEIRGFSENNNLALKLTSGKYCFVLNDDTEFSCPLIDTLVEDMKRLPESAAIVSPRVDNADGTLQLCGRPPYPSVNYALQQWHLYREPIDDTVGKVPVFGQVYATSNITGACFLIKRGTFERLGWFDETYFFTPEDIALSDSAVRGGYGVYVDSGVEVVHKWRTTASRLSPAIRPAAVRGSLMFFSRGSRCRYALLASAVWCAEFAKRLKAECVCMFNPTEKNRTMLETYRHITASIFTGRTPKEIFARYFELLNHS